jgi:hypothetical protein
LSLSLHELLYSLTAVFGMAALNMHRGTRAMLNSGEKRLKQIVRGTLIQTEVCPNLAGESSEFGNMRKQTVPLTAS